jgi:hypothetical protein
MTDRRCLRCGRDGCRDCPPLKKGDTVAALPPKLDIRPDFTGAGKTSFKPARNKK